MPTNKFNVVILVADAISVSVAASKIWYEAIEYLLECKAK